MSIADTITLSINFLALVFLGAQVMLARKAIGEAAKGQEREWDRQCKKSTIDMIVATAEYRESLKASLPLNDRDPEAVATFLEEIARDTAKSASLDEYLNHLEDMAVGVKQGVFDLGTISMLEGNRLINVIANYGPHMKEVRDRLDRPTIWSGIDDLVEMIKQYQKDAAATSNEPDSLHERHVSFMLQFVRKRL